MKRILNTFRKEKAYRQFYQSYFANRKETFPMLISGLSEGAVPAFYASFLHDLRQRESVSLCILPSEKDCSHMAAVLEDYHIRTATYTLRDMVYQNITASHDFEHERLQALDAILTRKVDVVLTTPDA